MARGHTSLIFASYAHELPYFEHFKGKKMKKWLLCPREGAAWQREWGRGKMRTHGGQAGFMLNRNKKGKDGDKIYNGA